MGSGTLQSIGTTFATATAASPLGIVSATINPQLPAGVAQQLADAAFAQSQWREAWGYYLSALQSGEAVVDLGRCLLFGGRCALYLEDYGTAINLLAMHAEVFPTDPEGLFYLGRAYQASRRDHEALTVLNAASLLKATPKYLAALAQVAHSLAFGGFGFSAAANQTTYTTIAGAALDASLSKDPDHLDSLIETMLLALDCGELDKAIETLGRIVAKQAKHGRERVRGATTTLALALLRGGFDSHVAGIKNLTTYSVGRRILERVKPQGEPPPSKADLAAVKVLARDPRLGAWATESLAGKFGWAPQPSAVRGPAEAISIDADFVCPVRPRERARLRALVTRLQALPEDFAGLVELDPRAPVGSRSLADVRALLVRKKYWNEIAAFDAGADWDGITELALARLNLFAIAGETQRGGAALALNPPPAAPRVIVLSRHGPRMAGGGEQFLRIAGDTYAAQGADVLFAGLSDDWSEASTDWPAERDGPVALGFVYEDVAAFRAFCLRNAVDAVHVISGLGEFVLDACRGLNVRVIYGVHFWREFIPARVLSRPYYPDVTLADAKPLSTMSRLLERSDFAYVNSDFCADIARAAYQWSPPIIYSVPIEDEAARPLGPARQDGYVLLANARADKGWHLLLDIAERLPERAFVAIASQSDMGAALADVGRRGLNNIQVIGRTDRMEELYAGAFVVVVPSFTFVETFSRMVIEAGRLARPVLMADSGNLSYLGEGTSLVLPNEPDAWAHRIAHLGRDAVAYAEAISESMSISERYSGRALKASLTRLPVATGKPRVLVCVGSGIGNICHTTPMIQRLADHFDAPIDVLVAGDFAGSSAVMAGAPAVGQVFEKYVHVSQRPYDIVLVTHSFGSIVASFNAPRVLVSRDFASFDPASDMHEATFNLDFAKRAIGIDYSQADTTGYFFGAAARTGRARPVVRGKIGFHAGSKGGIWAAKRWPGFAQLAGRLIGDGFEVVSVGTSDEYVAGTTDKTGLTIARMAEELSSCEVLVTNDSGVMNVANALGVPIVAIFAPTNPVTRGPRHSQVRILTPGTDCHPCEANAQTKNRFTEGKCQCIALISVDDVLAAVRSLEVDAPIRVAAE